MRLSKAKRQEELRRILTENPFLTDEELARLFSVSIQTIRLDRGELKIPEVRERVKQVAAHRFDPIRALTEEEVIGEVVDLILDERAISLLTIGKEHVFSRTKIARGHILFAQANSLAVALTNAEIALTAQANLRFLRPVYLEEKVIAKAFAEKEKRKRKGILTVRVESFVNGEIVLSGDFLIYRNHDRLTRREDVKDEKDRA